MLDDEVRLFANQFSPASFEKLQERLAERNQVLNVIGKILTERMRTQAPEVTAEMIQPFQADLEKLRIDLGLPPDFDFVKYNSFMWIVSSNPEISYELFLAKLFDDREISELILELGRVIKMADILSDPELFIQELAGKMRERGHR